MTNKTPTIILATGGTGGHIFPAVALAEELIRREYRAVMVTDARFSRFMQNIATVKSGQVMVHTIVSAKFSKSPLAFIRMLVAIIQGVVMAWRLLCELQPEAVVGFGGYPSFPTVMAAWLRGVPVFLHEQNAVMGKSNRILSLVAKYVALSFAPTSGIPARVATMITGNPVRDEIADLVNVEYPDMSGDINILIVGGSLGAAVFSKVVPSALASLPTELQQRLNITQQCREEDLAKVRAEYAASGIRAELAPFFGDMAGLMARVHLVIGRAGASTVAELLAAARPAILVPYPHATADHQAANAAIMVDAGGGWLLREDDFTSDKLTALLSDLLSSQSLQKAHSRLKQIPYTSAAARLADMVLG